MVKDMKTKFFFESESRRGDDACQSHPCLHSGRLVDNENDDDNDRDDDDDTEDDDDTLFMTTIEMFCCRGVHCSK